MERIIRARSADAISGYSSSRVGVSMIAKNTMTIVHYLQKLFSVQLSKLLVADKGNMTSNGNTGIHNERTAVS